MKWIFLFLMIGPMGLSAQYFFGQSEHPMNRKAENIDVLKFWGNTDSIKLQLYETAYDLLSKEKTSSYIDVVNDEQYQKLCNSMRLYLLGGPMLGNVKKDGISIWVRTTQPSKVQVKAFDGKSESLSNQIMTEFEGDLAGRLKLNGLLASTTYTYKIIINDTIEVSNERYFFRTLPDREDQERARIVFGSCPHRWGLGNQQLFNTISQRSPTAMFLLGDIAVQDRMDHIGMHRADYLLRDFQEAWSGFASNVPVYASWDDHDYFGDDLGGIPDGYSNLDRINVRKVFRNSWANPSYGLQHEGVFFATEIGSAKIVMTDNRYFRKEIGDSFLGDAQFGWLKQQITTCNSPFLILSCGTMWSDQVSNGKDSWGMYDPKRRQEIFDLIEKNKVTTVIFISGDRHGARGFTIESGSGFEFHEFQVASLGGRVGPPTRKPEWRNQLYGTAGVFAFGELTLDEKNRNKYATFRLIDQEGEVLFKKRLTSKDLKP